jgi:hypothetical protein
MLLGPGPFSSSPVPAQISRPTHPCFFSLSLPLGPTGQTYSPPPPLLSRHAGRARPFLPLLGHCRPHAGRLAPDPRPLLLCMAPPNRPPPPPFSSPQSRSPLLKATGRRLCPGSLASAFHAGARDPPSIPPLLLVQMRPPEGCRRARFAQDPPSPTPSLVSAVPRPSSARFLRTSPSPPPHLAVGTARGRRGSLECLTVGKHHRDGPTPHPHRHTATVVNPSLLYRARRQA